MQAEVIRYDAFTRTIGKGNPAGIIFEGDAYSACDMQSIAKAVGFNECCFICSSAVADYRLRYFTPGYETPLCGHATIAAISALMERKNARTDIALKIETLAGIMAVQYHAATHEVVMEQANAQFVEFRGDTQKLLQAIGLDMGDYDERYPIAYGSTGSWTVIVPIKTLPCFSMMLPQNELFPEILTQNPRASVHPMTFECFDSKHTLHGRHFSSCYSGTIEDSVTGTASGVMGAYYLQYVRPSMPVDMLVEQGNEIGKEGTVHVSANKDGEAIKVKIAGQAVFAGTFAISAGQAG